jgi:hypothetical protein
MAKQADAKATQADATPLQTRPLYPFSCGFWMHAVGRAK